MKDETPAWRDTTLWWDAAFIFAFIYLVLGRPWGCEAERRDAPAVQAVEVADR
jgi:hypothetical protein